VEPTDRVFLDSNILIYAFGQDRRTPVAEALVSQTFDTSVQILNEFINVSRKKLKIAWPDIDFAIERIVMIARDVLPITVDRQRDGVRLAKRYNLAIHEATILATALSSGCAIFWSEDMHDGLVIDGRLTIRNPFA